MITETHRLWLVVLGSHRVICTGLDREDAKREAHNYMGGNPDTYIVEPLSNIGDTVRLQITVSV